MDFYSVRLVDVKNYDEDQSLADWEKKLGKSLEFLNESTFPIPIVIEKQIFPEVYDLILHISPREELFLKSSL